MKSTQLISHMDIAHLLLPTCLSEGVVPTEKVVCLCHQFPEYRSITEEEARQALAACGIPLSYMPSSESFWVPGSF
ncbi:MAG: hypothetical protein HY986_02475 [Candidatus Melainabacteria bacterium]|nr:hypothetical protein [Candidatus Melainabacteria bacterium]